MTDEQKAKRIGLQRDMFLARSRMASSNAVAWSNLGDVDETRAEMALAKRFMELADAATDNMLVCGDGNG